MISPVALLLVLIVCVLAQALFVGAEMSLSMCHRGRLRQRAAAGQRAARAAERLVAQPRVTLATTLVGANASGLIAVIAAAVFIAQRGASPLWAVLLVVPPMLIVGQIVPKSIMQVHADRGALLSAIPLTLLAYPMRPFIWIATGFAAAMTRVAGTDREKAFVTRDELAMLIETEPETDTPQISADEREMIANVFELSEYVVRDLMVPLSEVTALPEDTSLLEAGREVADKQHSRMPIYRSRVDDIVGVVHVFDVLQATTDGKSRTVADVVRPVTYVPETMKAIDLLVELQAEGQHLAIVVDEYGGAVGIVTIEDLLETIVGDIDDEHDRGPSPIAVERLGVWRMEAKTSVARINQELDLGLPESDDYETIAGLLIERFRRIPDPGETLTVGGVLVEVVAATERAIESVRLSRKRK